MNEEEQKAIWKCFNTNYQSMPCLQCEMNYICEAWRKKIGATPSTKVAWMGDFAHRPPSAFGKIKPRHLDDDIRKRIKQV